MEKLLLNLIGSAWIVDILRKLCVFFDWLIYSVSAWFFDVFFDIAKMDMTLGGETSILLVLVERIKLFIGIFALFVFVKLLVSNLANPDRINESGSKVVMKVFVSIILLVVSPTVFDLMNDFQKAVIVDYNTIPKLLLGPTVGEAFDQNAGQSFMGTMFSLFFYCTGECEQESIDAIESVRRGEQQILSLVNYTNGTGVQYEYPVLSGVAGMMMIYYFATFAIALGVRIFKLTVLQLLAPIPIITYMDPKREEFCKKYLTLFINTYIEVFVRLLVILMAYNLGLMIVSTLTSAQASDTGVLVKLFLIIALFQFAKAFPKIVSDLFGINSSLGELKGPGGFLGGIAGTAVGFAAGMRSSKLAGVHGLSRAAHVASSVYGGASGGRKGLSSGGIIGGIKGFKDEMYKKSREGYVRADQIYTSGGYGNYVKGKLLNNEGVDEFVKNESARLSEAVNKATQSKTQFENAQSLLSNLKSEAQRLYDEGHNGGLAGNATYQAQLVIRKKAAERLAQRPTDVRAQASFSTANTAINALESAYKRDIRTFYDNAMSGRDRSTEATNLKAIGSRIEHEIKDVVPSISLNSYTNIDTAQVTLDGKISVANADIQTAKGNLNSFNNSKIVRYTSFKK